MGFLEDTLNALGLGKFPVSQPFGANPNNPRYGYGPNGHQGTDIGTPAGTPVKMPWTGQLVAGYEAGGFGNYVKAVRPDGFTVLVGHLSEFVGIKPGQTLNVQAGQVIGKTGSTGNSSAPHAHVQFRPSVTGNWAAGLNPATLTGSVTPPRNLPQVPGTPFMAGNPAVSLPILLPIGGALHNPNNPATADEVTGTEAVGVVGGAVADAAGGAFQNFLNSDFAVNAAGVVVGLTIALLGVLLLAPSFINFEMPSKPTVVIAGGKGRGKKTTTKTTTGKKGTTKTTTTVEESDADADDQGEEA